MAIDTHELEAEDHSFLLQKVQPALTGLMDGSLSTIAPIFAIAIASQNPHYAFIAGLATSFGAAISMAFAEGLSDTGELTGRGNPAIRGAITGVGTFLGGILHTLPFLIPHYHVALVAAAVVVGFELIALAYVRVHFFKIGFLGSVLSVTLAGALIAVVSALLGAAG
jgi:VIT1/CCC1 family predicted Fe2+/Mn2+ transporter